MELGLFHNLSGGTQLNDFTIEMAWAKRMRRLVRLGESSGATIDARSDGGDVGIPDPSAWLGAERTWDDEGRGWLAAGGAGRVSPDPSAAGLGMSGSGAVLSRSDNVGAVTLDAATLAALMDQEKQMRLGLQELLDQLTDPGVTPALRVELERQVEALDAQISRLERIRVKSRLQRAP